MSTHPNAILLLKLKPDDLARKTYRAILAESGADQNEDSPSITIAGERYNTRIMEGDYDEGMQIAASEGDIVIFDLVTYGYGEQIAWDDLVNQQANLAEWAQDICARHHCTASFFVTANYW